ncbi:protein phosphatase 1 regulatory subunit 3C-B isoform X2 [Fundulus heteroclitus]|uniref:protein phosphatase 1 regulatory subunit 3C-B isoform X2 n=1 Tax=Fundulus heteroclitus TaxID=8078 RepID=UPI00165A4ACC|nr:protein phosphatase 1 regulatory subunit 3C-B isoform X2 [Fundulus heteroclitus]
MPVDMAIRICLASSPPLHSFLSNHDSHPYAPAGVSASCQPLRPCLSSGCCSSVSTESQASAAELPRRSLGKRVVFADSQGLALTTVYVFSEDEDDPLAELQFHLTELEGATEALCLEDIKDSAESGSGLVLDFTPPSADYLDLRNRLKAQQVCLETCSVQDHLLSGTIQDLISFGGVEFCIKYQTKEHTYWDNNLGNNYRLTTVDPTGRPNWISERSTGQQTPRDRQKMDKMDFDPFGSPRTSAGIFPEWQSWGRVETSAPYW